MQLNYKTLKLWPPTVYTYKQFVPCEKTYYGDGILVLNRQVVHTSDTNEEESNYFQNMERFILC